MSDVFMCGIDYSNTDMAGREAVVVALDQIAEHIQSDCAFEGHCLLSTCNRVEWYLASAAVDTAQIDKFCQKVAALSGFPVEKLVVRQKEEAVSHLFRVAAGLESLVLGESQILGQVKRSFDEGCREKNAKGEITALFKRAISIGKRVRRDTEIGAGNVSVSSVAVQYAQEALGGLADRVVLLVGAGQVSYLTAVALRGRGVKSVFVANKMHDEATRLAASVAGEAVRYDRLVEKLGEVDIVISSTAAPHYVIRRDEVEEALLARQEKPLFLLDLAMPRDIDPAVAELANVHLCNVDDLRTRAETGSQSRQQAALEAADIVKTEVKRYCQWRKAVPAIVSLHRQASEISREQAEIALSKAPHLGEREQQIIAMVAEKTAEKMVAPAIRQLIERLGHQDSDFWGAENYLLQETSI